MGIENRPLHVYIIESPSAHDAAAGTSEGRHFAELLRLAGIDSTYTLVFNADVLRQSIAKLTDQANSLGASALVLHVSAHGNDSGIQLTSGDVIDWAEMRALISPVNTAA